MVAYSLKVRAQVLGYYIHFALIYTAYNISPLLPMKYLINKDGKPITPFKLATVTKPSISHLHVLFFLCVVQKSIVHVRTKVLNMHHQAQKGFRGIFIVIPQHQKGCLVYVPHKHRIVSSYDAVFDESFSSALAYTSQPYSEVISMLPVVSYIPYAKSSKEKLTI